MSTMSYDYESLLKSGKPSDVVLVVGEKKIRAHKHVLSARSPVFAAMFAYDTKEAQENRVEMIDVDVDMVELMVRYSYSGKVDNLDRYAEDLLIVADRYLMDGLKLECEQHLSSQISVSSFSDLLIFADTYHATVLTSKCLDCIARNVTQMIDSEECDKIVKTDLLSKIREHLNLCFSEQNFLSQITTESFADLLIFADTYQVIELYIKCLEYIAHNLDRIVTSEEFDKIVFVGNADLLDKLCESLNLYFSKGKFAYQISCDSVADLLIFADTYQVIELYMTCLKYITNNFAKVVTSKEWMKIAVRADLLAQLYDQLHLEYSKKIHGNGEKKANSKKKKKPNNCTSVPDLDFEKYLLKYSNVINGKEEMTDVILLVGEVELKVHKSILSARSSVFAKMFAYDSIREEEENRVQITDVDVNVLKLLIMYIYSGKVEGLVRYLAKLLVAADKFQLNCFKSMCEQKLLSKVITTKSVSGLLIIADKHQITELYAKCLDYLANNRTQVMASKGWNKKILVKTDLLAKICDCLNWDLSEQLLLCPINVESVCDLLIIADKHLVTELSAKSIDYITNNRTQVMSTEGWKKLLIRADLLNLLFEHLSFIYAQVLAYEPYVLSIFEYVNYHYRDYDDDHYDHYDDCRGTLQFGYRDSSSSYDSDYIRRQYNSEY